MSCYGYIRVSTEDQAESGLGLEAQRSAIQAYACQRTWQLLTVFQDRAVSGARVERPGLSEALTTLERGDVLIVSRLDRLSRSVQHFAQLVDRARKEGWSLVCLDLGVDMSTPMGEALAGMAAVFAQLERRLISDRIKDALAAKRKQGHTLGKKPQIPADVEHYIQAAACNGNSRSPTAIARDLNQRNVPTVHGGQWRASTVARVLCRQAL